MRHSEAYAVAESLVEYLRPACTRIEIGGAFRRGEAGGEGIEDVGIPDLEPGARGPLGGGKPNPPPF